MAANTILPVIGVPVNDGHLDGADLLHGPGALGRVGDHRRHRPDHHAADDVGFIGDSAVVVEDLRPMDLGLIGRAAHHDAHQGRPIAIYFSAPWIT